MDILNWTLVSSLILSLWAIRYITLAWNKEVYPNPVSWFVWSLVGVALFLTAEASDAKEVYFASIIAAISPVMIFCVILLRENKRVYNLTKHEKLCLVLALAGYGFWFFLKDTPGLAQWSLYWMIGVDLLVLWPTFEQVLKDPMSDKPVPWMTFGVGYAVAGFAISDHTITNWALPLYMFIGSWVVAAPMVVSRLKNKSVASEWL